MSYVRRACSLHDLPAYHRRTHASSYKPGGVAKRARAAYLSAQFAYRTFPRVLKHIFDYGQLHLGHFAAAYALKEAPNKSQRDIRVKQVKTRERSIFEENELAEKSNAESRTC